MDLINAERIRWIAGASLVLAACTSVPPQEYPPDHPANPEAPGAAAMPTLSTLTTYRSLARGVAPEAGAAPNAGQSARPQPEQPSQEGAHEHRH
jgi:hypothetical protein